MRISAAEHLGDYRVRFAFDNGREGVADLRATVFDDPRSAFAPLRETAVFQRFFIERGVLCWPGGLDIAPEYLFFLTFRDDPGLRGLFQEWGYVGAKVAV